MLWILFALVAVVVLFLLRPSSVYRRRVLADYKRWKGRPLSPVDPDLVATVRMMKKQGLTIRESRMVLCTYVDHGALEALKHLGCIQAGEQYVATALPRGHPPQTSVQFGMKLRARYENQFMDYIDDFRQLEGDISRPSTFPAEIRAFLFFIYDFAIYSGDDHAAREALSSSFTGAHSFDESERQLLVERRNEYATAMSGSGDPTKGYLLLGNVFAAHTGNEADMLVVMWAVTAFKKVYSEVAVEVANHLGGSVLSP